MEERDFERLLARKESATKGVLSRVNSQEVKLLVLSPASGNKLQKNIQDFESLSDKIRLTRVCEDAVFTHRVSAGMSYKTRPDEDDGFWQLIPLYTLSRVNPQSRAFAAIPGGTLIGPIIEVQIAIPSPNERDRTSCVALSRGKSRFVDEIHIPKAELRSSAALLSGFQKSEEGESCLAQSKTSIQETGAAHVKSPTSNKETCADTLSITPSQAFFVHIKNHSYDQQELESYSCQLFVWRSSVSSGLQKWLQKWCVVTIKMNDNLTQHFVGTP